MARGRSVFHAAVVAVLLGAAILVAISLDTPGKPGSSSAGSGFEPEVLLRDVEMREIRKGGSPYRVFSDNATYLLHSGKFSGTGVTLALSGKAGETVVRAPQASWDMRAGRIFLPEGGVAENREGWVATVGSANLSLPERTLFASGKAKISGPGLSVVGDNLVWNMREGTVALASPKTRLDQPSRAIRRKG